MRLLFLLLLSTTCYGQRFMLVDRKLYEPNLLSDTITMEQIESGYMPIETAYIDSIVSIMGAIMEKLKVNTINNVDAFTWRVGSSLFIVSTTRFAYGDRYHVTLKLDNIPYSIVVCDRKNRNGPNARYLSKVVGRVKKT